MKVWMGISPHYGHGVQKAWRNLRSRAPRKVEFVENWRTAQLTIDQIVDCPTRTVVNDPNPDIQMHHCEMIERGESSQAHVYNLYCNHYPSTWFRKVLPNAKFIWSYLYDARELVGVDMNLILRPLGVDPNVYNQKAVAREGLVYAYGHIAADEAIDSAWRACAKLGKELRQSGENFGWTSNYLFLPIASTEEDVAIRYSAVKYALATRGGHGFELANVEAPLCGARPICFDNQFYRQWFEKTSLFVPQKADIKEELATIFDGPWQPVSEEEKSHIKENFSWDKLANEFWRMVLE